MSDSFWPHGLTIAYQAPLSMGFSRQEYWSGLPFPSPGDLPDLGIEPGFPTLQADALPSEPPGKSKSPINLTGRLCEETKIEETNKNSWADFSDSFLLQVFMKYWIEIPVLYSRSLLVILNIVVCICPSCHPHLSPFHRSPLVTISLFWFSKSVSLFLFCK